MTEMEDSSCGDLLTHAEAAARIGVSTRTLNRYVAHGLLCPLHLPSGYRRYEPQVIDALLTRRSTK